MVKSAMTSNRQFFSFTFRYWYTVAAPAD